jgi:signal recognition particle receptor subunit beta
MKQEMQRVKIVVTGPFGAGKTQFINTISEIGVVTTERRVSRAGEGGAKELTTVAMDFGQIAMGEDLVLDLFGTPGQKRFEFMFSILSQGMWGFVVVVDSTDRRSYPQAQEVLEFFDGLAPVPYVVAANKQDKRGALPPHELSKALHLGPEVRVLPCVASDRSSVHRVLLNLVSSLPGHRGGNQQVC